MSCTQGELASPQTPPHKQQNPQHPEDQTPPHGQQQDGKDVSPNNQNQKVFFLSAFNAFFIVLFLRVYFFWKQK